MNNLRVTAASLSLVIIFTAPLLFLRASDNRERLTLEWCLNNYDVVTPEMLNDPANSAILTELKRRALSSHVSDVVLPLLKAGDMDVINDTLARYRDEKTRYDSSHPLFRSANADIIALLGEDLNRSEPAVYGGDGELLVPTLPEGAAVIIRELILTSGKFSSGMQSWANSLHLQGERLRQPLKVWWNQNKTLLGAKRYGEVQPPH